MLRFSVAVAVLAFALGGCGSSDGDTRGSEQSDIDLRFAYVGIADTGMIDQSLTITNPSRDIAAVPTLSFQALDADLEPLADVTVTTVFGSDRGLVMAPADYEVFDILRFEGVGAERVKDVKVTVEKVRTLDDPGTAYPEVDYLDAQGRSVQLPYEARLVRVRNPGAGDHVVRLVGIRWDVPTQGQSQQARSVTAVGEPISVNAGSFADIPLAARFTGRFDSVKAYISTE